MNDYGSSFALVGGLIVLTLVFTTFPFIIALAFFVWRKYKPPFFKSKLSIAALVAALIQLILSGPLLADVFPFIPDNIYPWKTLDYTGMNLFAGTVISLSIIVLWRKSYTKRASTDPKLTKYLIGIATAVLLLQINSIHTYTVHNKENSNKFYQQQLALAAQMGTQVYSANSPKLGSPDLISDPFTQKIVYLDGGKSTYTIVYGLNYTNEGSFGRYHIDEINIQTSDRVDSPCTVDVNNSPVKEDCRHLGDSSNGFAVYGLYVIQDIGRFKSDQPQLFDCTFQKGNTRIGISIFNKFSAEDCVDLAEAWQETAPDQAIKKDY